MPRRFSDWLAPVVYLASNWISLIGVVLVTTAGVLWVLLLPSLLRGDSRNPYIGILEFLLLPVVFFAGLLLIPAGIWWYRRRNGSRLPPSFPPVDLGNPRFRRLLAFVSTATLLNLIIGGQLTYRATSYMETVSFCGQTCHTVMQPEYTAYQNSPHAKVACVNCHIGPGANWFVKSKISGSWQVISVTFNLYPRPIPTPIKNLRPARETCEECHWPQKFGGDRVRVIDKFADDEKTTHTKTVLLMHIGGGNGYQGIHGAHMGPGIVIRYAASDEKRLKIPWVEYTKEGRTDTFQAADYKGKGPGNLEVRVMDCIDCHNRPSHSFELPSRALDEALAGGQIDASLPFVKKVAMEAIQAPYATRDEADHEIVRHFTEFYRKNYSQLSSVKGAQIERSARGVLAVFSRNVFPAMRVAWGVYPNNIGHEDFPGCFRCHDERQQVGGSKTVPQDCDTCHKTLAIEEENPKVLSELGLAPAAGGQ
jgi:hypothetical protein